MRPTNKLGNHVVRFNKLLCSIGLFLISAPAAQAGLIVTVGDLTLSAGSAGYVPVYIKTDSGTENIGFTSFEFHITTAGPTRLEFTDSPVNDPSFGDPNYVFSGQSGDEGFLGLGNAVGVTHDTFIGSDQALNADLPVSSTSNLLLAYLPVTALTALPPIAGDVFTISLVPLADSAPLGIDGNTGFSDQSLSQYYAFSSVSGSVTIAEAHATPEPSSLALFGLGAAGMAIARRFRKT